MDKPDEKRRGRGARPLGDIVGRTIDEIFARQGFASRELVMRWSAVVGDTVAAHCEPVKIQWPRPVGDAPPDPATLVLRVEGPAALEIQHQADVIVGRINRFLGWPAIGRLSLRQAPLQRRAAPPPRPAIPEAEIARQAANLQAVESDDLRLALARLGAALKGS